MANWKLNLEKLEKAFEGAKENGYEPVYRICEGRTQKRPGKAYTARIQATGRKSWTSALRIATRVMI